MVKKWNISSSLFNDWFYILQTDLKLQYQSSTFSNPQLCLIYALPLISNESTVSPVYSSEQPAPLSDLKENYTQFRKSLKEAKLIPPTHKNVTTHYPGLVQALE